MAKTTALRSLLEDYLNVCASYNGEFGKREPDEDEVRQYKEALAELNELDGGEWTRTPPTFPGIYRVADVHGNERLTPVELVVRDGELVSYKNGAFVSPKKAWRGWWWSRPNPNLPRAG